MNKETLEDKEIYLDDDCGTSTTGVFYTKDVKEKLQEFIDELKEEIEPLRYDIRIDQASKLIEVIDKKAKEKFGDGLLK